MQDPTHWNPPPPTSSLSFQDVQQEPWRQVRPGPRGREAGGQAQEGAQGQGRREEEQQGRGRFGRRRRQAAGTSWLHSWIDQSFLKHLLFSLPRH